MAIFCFGPLFRFLVYPPYQYLHQFANLLYKQLDHRHMFTQWSLDLNELVERAMFQQPATYFTDAALEEHWRDFDFPSRKLRRRPTPADLAEFRTKQADLRMLQHKNNLIQSPFPLRIAGPKHFKTTTLFFHNNTMLRMA